MPLSPRAHFALVVLERQHKACLSRIRTLGCVCALGSQDHADCADSLVSRRSPPPHLFSLHPHRFPCLSRCANPGSTGASPGTPGARLGSTGRQKKSVSGVACHRHLAQLCTSNLDCAQLRPCHRQIEAHDTEFDAFARTQGWYITGRRASCRNQLNIRSFHAQLRAHCSPVC
jgi:hypothetical protein